MGYLLYRGIHDGGEDKNGEMGEGLYTVFYRFVYMDAPGTNKQCFYIKMDRVWYRRGDVITNGKGITLEVVRVYKRTWWRRLLLWMGFSVRMMQVKVRPK